MLLVITLAWFIFDIVKNNKKAVLLDLLIIVYALVIMYVYTIQGFTEKARFYMFEPRYSATTKRLMSELSQRNDTSWGEYQDNSLFGLSESRIVVYMKQGDDILIYFPTWTNFFRSGGYVYYNSATARDFWEYPSRYDEYDDPALSEDGSEEPSCDYTEPLNDDWDYIKIY